jgi:hypothetical protein
MLICLTESLPNRYNVNVASEMCKEVYYMLKRARFEKCMYIKDMNKFIVPEQ